MADLWHLTGISTILAAILIILFYIYLHQLQKTFEIWKRKNIPYIKPIPFLGNFKNVVFRKMYLNEQIQAIYNEFKKEPLIGMFIFNRPYLMVKDPNLIKTVLIKDSNVFLNRGVTINEKVDPITYNNLFTIEDSQWKNCRQKLSPTFSSGKIRLMKPLIETCCQNLLKKLDSKHAQIIDVKDLMSRYTTDVISMCAFGFDAESLKIEDGLIYKMARKLSDPNSLVRCFAMVCMFFLPSVATLLRLSLGDKNAVEFFQNLFKKVVEQRKEGNIVKNDFIDMLLNLKKQETKDEVYKLDDIKMFGHAITFFFAGNDTTSTMMAFLLNELAIKTDIQNKMRTEVDEITAQYGDLTYEHLQKLKYMDMVIKETLRKYPITSMLFRKSNADYKFQDTGLIIEKGTHIIIPVAGLHYDPEYYPEPDKFYPERFDPDKFRQVPYTMLPFGDGPRVCIGERFAMMIMKIALFRILKNYEFLKCEKTQYPIEINVNAAFLQPKGEVPVRCLRRTFDK